MPHQESGLLALRTTDVGSIDRATRFFLERAPHPRVEMVRGAGGKGVWLCFGSFVGADMDAFYDEENGATLARALEQPLWLGHAIGGYSNEQTAMAFSKTGKLLWRSEFDFSFPPNQRAEANDPFSSANRRQELIEELRASSGYGLIGKAFSLDWSRILDVDVGDAIFATDKRVFDAVKGAAQHARWLASRFKPPEGEQAGATLIAEEDFVAFRFLAAVKPELFGAALARLLEHRRVSARGMRLSVSRSKEQTVFRLEGPRVRPLSPTLVSERFLSFLTALHGASVCVFGWNEGEQPQVRAGEGRGDVMAFMRARHEPLPLDGTFSPVALEASAAQTKKVERVRARLRKAAD